MEILNTTTVGWIVAISILTSIVASYAAFSFAERIAAAKGRAHWLWLASGSASMGLGVWSMHYLGMLSVRLPIDVTYHVPTVLLSLFSALFASAVALEVVSSDSLGEGRHLAGSVLMASGIGAMHYIGMHAMRCAAMHRYDLRVVALSVVIAVVFSYSAIDIAFSIRRRPKVSEWLRVGGATIMGLGIAATHYIAMTAVKFERTSLPFSTDNTVRVSTISAVAVAFTMSLVLFGALVSTILDRRINHQMKEVLDQLSEERDRFQAAAESTMDALFLCTALRGPDGEIEDFIYQYLNRNVEKILARSREQLIGCRMSEVHPVSATLGMIDLYKQVVVTGTPLVHEFRVQDSSVLSSWVRVQAVKIRDGIAITASDITLRKEAEEHILHMAHHDALTGLLNRTLLRDRIQQAIDQAYRHHTAAAVFLLDLDGFKQINDTFGHAVGDFVLVTVAERLKQLVRATDSVIRIGGDEFVIVITDLVHAADASLCAEKLTSAFAEPMSLDGRILDVTCSVGGAIYPDSARTPDDLIMLADAAMYRAKQSGKNCFRLSEAEVVAS